MRAYLGPLFLIGGALLAMLHTVESYYCPCPYRHDPVCGTDGKTYNNECFAECQKRNRNPHLEWEPGTCVGMVFGRSFRKDDDCDCTREYKPVCGSDGIAYANQCMFLCAKKSNPELTDKSEGCVEPRNKEDAKSAEE